MAKALFCLHTILWINGFPKPNNKKQNTHTQSNKKDITEIHEVENNRFPHNTLYLDAPPHAMCTHSLHSILLL